MATYGYFAACIKIKLRLYLRNRWGYVTSSGLHQRQAASLNIRHKFDCATPAASNKISCVFIIYATDVDALLQAACIKDKLHLNIRFECERYRYAT